MYMYNYVLNITIIIINIIADFIGPLGNMAIFELLLNI